MTPDDLRTVADKVEAGDYEVHDIDLHPDYDGTTLNLVGLLVEVEE